MTNWKVVMVATLFLASACTNIMLYNENRSLQAEASQLRLVNENFTAVLAQLEATIKASSSAVDEYTAEVRQLTRERNKWRREAMEARKNDEAYKAWSNTPLPDGVISKYERVRK